MAGSSSGKAAYWTGVLVGLVMSVALVAVLSVVSERSGDPAGTTTTASAPDPAPAQAATPEPAPQPETTEVTENAPAPTPEPEASPEPEPQEVAVATPQPAPAPEPAPAAEPEPADPAPAAPTPAPAAPASSTLSNGGALVAHSEFFNGDPDEPVLSIVLTDIGANGGRSSDVFLLPAPLTLVIDPSTEAAQDLVIDARDSGFEVLMSMGNAAGGSEADVAAAVSQNLNGVDGVIGVAAFNDALAGNNAINGLLTITSTQGMALFDATQESGGAGFRTAKSMGLPTAPLGRMLDGETSTALVFQALERAAFDARRLGSFIVVARAEPAILTGLRRWMNVKAGKSAAVAPLSEVVRRNRN